MQYCVIMVHFSNEVSHSESDVPLWLHDEPYQHQ